jgi:hypothetical protein
VPDAYSSRSAARAPPWFSGVQCSRKVRKTTHAGAAFHNRPNCTGKGSPPAAPFNSRERWGREPPSGAEAVRQLSLLQSPSEPYRPLKGWGSELYRKGRSSSGTLTTHDRHPQEQHRYVQATECQSGPDERSQFSFLAKSNIYSITTNQEAISRLFRKVNRNLARMPGVFPDCPAP